VPVVADETTGSPANPVSGEVLGPLVHLTRLKHDAQQAAKEGRERFRLGDWDQRPEHQQDLDIRIAEAIAEVVTAAVRGRFAEVLRVHYLAGFSDGVPGRNLYCPVCACSEVFLEWHPSVGEAVEAWIGHVMEIAGNEGGTGDA
jgi:hypothetical protein